MLSRAAGAHPAFARIVRSVHKTSISSLFLSCPVSQQSVLTPIVFRNMSAHQGESTLRPEPDKVLKDIADYVHNYQIDSELAFETARLCLIDTVGCGLEGLRFPECSKLLGPVVDGTIVPNGTLESGPNRS